MLSNYSIQIFNYVSSAFLGAFGMLCVVTAWYYGMKGYERTNKAAKYGALISLFALGVCLFDMTAEPFTYLRPSDSITVYWGRYILFVWLIPFAVVVYHQLLHDPSVLLERGLGKFTEHSDTDKHSNMGHVFNDAMWLTFSLAVLSSIFSFISTIANDSAVRYASFALCCLFGLLYLILILNYISQYGFRYIKLGRSSSSVNVSYGFWTKSRWYWREWICFALLVLIWLTFTLSLLLGPTVANVITYDYESLMNLIAFWLFIPFVWLSIYFVRKTHVKVLIYDI